MTFLALNEEKKEKILVSNKKKRRKIMIEWVQKLKIK